MKRKNYHSNQFSAANLFDELKESFSNPQFFVEDVKKTVKDLVNVDTILKLTNNLQINNLVSQFKPTNSQESIEITTNSVPDVLLTGDLAGDDFEMI